MCGKTNEGRELNLNVQVAPVKKSLASVRKMCGAGNRVVFEDLGEDVGGYVQSLSTGDKTPIMKVGGTYSVSLWRPRTPPKVLRGNRFDALSDGEEIEGAGSASSSDNAGSAGFTRHA